MRTWQSIATYHDFVPGFRALLQQEKSLSAFYAAVKRQLAAEDKGPAAIGNSPSSAACDNGVALKPGSSNPARNKPDSTDQFKTDAILPRGKSVPARVIVPNFRKMLATPGRAD